MQNSFGARWRSKRITCDKLQAEFGSTIDVEVERAFQPFRNMLGARGGRGETGPSLEAKDIDGAKYLLHPGGKPEIREPQIDIKELPDGNMTVKFTLADIKQLEWAKAKVRAMYPERSVKFDDSAIPARESGYLQKPIHMSIKLGGKDFFRGLLKSVFNLLGVTMPEIALGSEFDGLRNFVVKGEGIVEDFARWSSEQDPFMQHRFGEFDHFIGVWRLDGQVFAMANLYGGIPFIFRLAEGSKGDDFAFGYLVNPLRDTDPAENRELSFDPSRLPLFDECKMEPGPEIWAAFEARVKSFLQNYLARADSKRIEEIVTEVLGPHDGKLFDQAMSDELSMKLAEYIVHRLKKPERVDELAERKAP